MLFAEVAGQDKVKKKLIAAVKRDRISHAQLFFGPEGCGSLALGIAYAQYIACPDKNDDDSCGECPSCRKFNKLEHPDLHFSFPVNTTQQVPKDPVSDEFIKEWREFILKNAYFRSENWYNHIGIENKQGLISRKEGEAIIRKLSMKPYESEYKFVIIWLPEKMNKESGNILLKTIEEPSQNTVLIFISEDPGQLLPTISSRLQPVKLDRIADEDIKKNIEDKYELSGAELDNISRLSAGNYIRALEIIDETEENEFNFEKFVELVRMCYKRDYLGLNGWVEELSATGRERLKSFFLYTLRLIRENFIMNIQRDELNYLADKEKDFSNDFHPYINGKNVIPLTKEINRAFNDIERNAYAKIVLFDLMIRIIKLIPTKKQLEQEED
ncbi:MAG: DNA polymerase III subunit delta [Bacteroidales bacterium]|nr:DNA polymerase III subunit delta [Bacteroidales bacterium]